MKHLRRPSAFALAVYAIITGSFATSAGLLFAASNATPATFQMAWLTATGVPVVIASVAAPFVLCGFARLRRRAR